VCFWHWRELLSRMASKGVVWANWRCVCMVTCVCKTALPRPPPRSAMPSLSVFVYAFTSHTSLLPIYLELQRRSMRRMKRVTHAAVAIEFVAYFCVMERYEVFASSEKEGGREFLALCAHAAMCAVECFSWERKHRKTFFLELCTPKCLSRLVCVYSW
jgi:hypothetical protein